MLTATDGPDRHRGAVVVIAGTAVSAALGWALLVLVARLLGASAYGDFALLWSLFFGVSGLLTGVQQEAARSSTAWEMRPSGRSIALVPSGVLVLAPVFVSVLLAITPRIREGLSSSTTAVVAASLVSLLLYAVQTVVVAVLGARSHWSHVSGIAVLAAVLRLVALVAVCTWTREPWLMVAGIGAGATACLLLLPVGAVRRAWTGRGAGDITGFVTRSSSTLINGVCVALVTSGLPFLVALTGDYDRSEAGNLFAVLTALRTPVVMPALALQLFLITYFVSRRDRLGRAAFALTMVVLAAGSVLTLGAAAEGPAVLSLILGDTYTVGRTVAAGFTASAVLLAALVVTTTALVAADRHRAATSGVVVVATLTVLVLVLGSALESRLLWAAVTAPAAGVLLHSMLLAREQLFEGRTPHR